jgi:hypothetical protein
LLRLENFVAIAVLEGGRQQNRGIAATAGIRSVRLHLPEFAGLA